MARSFTSINLPSHWNFETRNPQQDTVAWFEGIRRRSKAKPHELDMMDELGLKEIDADTGKVVRYPQPPELEVE